MRGPRRTARVLAAALFLAACAPADDGQTDGTTASRADPVIPMDTGTVRIHTATDTFTLSVEIAETADQRQVGLMERDTMPEDEGMIFLMDEDRPGTAGFWMYRTRIPLDIAYADSAGAIVAIRRMEPCTASYSGECPLYPPEAVYRMALETVAGYMEGRDIQVGDTITLVSREGGGA